MTDKPKIMLLGDSIRMSYQNRVKDLLASKACVVGPAENCQYSLYTLSSLNRWIDALGEPDIIHWNNGLHDYGHNPIRSPNQFPIETYVQNLEFILNHFKQITEKIIWATITPIRPNRAFVEEAWSWRQEEIDQYNESAMSLMTAKGVKVNDLHRLVTADYEKYLGEDQLHLSEAGIEVCAQAAAAAVRLRAWQQAVPSSAGD